MAVQREEQQKELEELRKKNAALEQQTYNSSRAPTKINSTASTEEVKDSGGNPRAVHDLCLMCAISEQQAIEIYQAIKDGLISGVFADEN